MSHPYILPQMDKDRPCVLLCHVDHIVQMMTKHDHRLSTNMFVLSVISIIMLPRLFIFIFQVSNALVQ